MTARFPRTAWFTLGLLLALSHGCSSSAGSGTGANGSGGATDEGSGGSATSSGPSTCTPTHCKADLQHTLYSQQFCDDAANGPCGTELANKTKCSLAHDVCTSDGLQDLATVKAACQTEFDALDKCDAANAGN